MKFKIQFFLITLIISSFLRAEESNPQFQVSLESFPINRAVTNFDSLNIRNQMIPRLVSPLNCEMCSSKLEVSKQLSINSPIEVILTRIDQDNRNAIIESQSLNDSGIVYNESLVRDSMSHPVFSISLQIPKSLGINARLFEQQTSKQEVSIGFWSENLSTWNIFRLRLQGHKNDIFSSNIILNKDKASSGMSYKLRLDNNNSINFGIHADVNHNILIPQNISTGGRITYSIKSGRHIFQFFIFGTYQENLSR